MLDSPIGFLQAVNPLQNDYTVSYVLKWWSYSLLIRDKVNLQSVEALPSLIVRFTNRVFTGC